MIKLFVSKGQVRLLNSEHTDFDLDWYYFRHHQKLKYLICDWVYPRLCEGLPSDLVPVTNNVKQECIPVGCVPAARWPYAGVCFLEGGLLPGGGVYVRGGVPAWGGYLPRGMYLPGWGVPAQEGGIPAWEVYLPRGVYLPGGVCSGGALRHIPPVNRITHTCKNITLAQLRCGR